MIAALNNFDPHWWGDWIRGVTLLTALFALGLVAFVLCAYWKAESYVGDRQIRKAQPKYVILIAAAHVGLLLSVSAELVAAFGQHPFTWWRTPFVAPSACLSVWALSRMLNLQNHRVILANERELIEEQPHQEDL